MEPEQYGESVEIVRVVLFSQIRKIAMLSWDNELEWKAEKMV